MEKKENKRKMVIFKKFFSIMLGIVFVMLFCGASYALWNFDFESEFNVLDVSSVTMELLESDEVISLDNAIPISDELGKLGEAFDFVVRTETLATMSIGYNIVLEKQEAPEGYSLFNDDEIKIYLTDGDDNVLLGPTLVSEISGNYVMYKKLNVHNSEIREIKDNYKLRVWIDEDVTSDRINENTNLLYKFKLGVRTSIDSTSDSTYKVTYNANGGEGVMSDSTFTFNELEELSSNTFVRPYYNFLGWSLKPNGEVIYNDGEEVSNITDVYNGKVNLYAVWEKVKYTTSVVVQNGTLTGDSSLLVPHAENGVFNLSSSQGTDAIVSCTNGQVGVFDNYVLTVEKLSANTVCTVNFVPSSTVLYTDGTFIINEKGSDRESNIVLHGAVVKEYEPFSATQSYVFSNSAAQLWLNEKDAIIDVEIGQEIKPTYTKYWFYQCANMKSGDFTNLNTANTINTGQMFADSGTNSSSYKLIGLEKWDVSNVDNMTYMFSQTGKNAEEWSITDISNWNVSKVKFMQFMFSFAGNKAQRFNLDLSAWDVSNVTNMNSLFSSAGSNASDWSIGDLSNWNVSNVTNMATMFHTTGINDDSWTIGDISSWNVLNVTNMVYMFNSVGNAVQNFNLNLSGWDTSSVTNMSFMFSSIAKDSETFIIEGLDNWDTSSVTDMSYMFYSAGRNASSWSIGDLSNWDVSKVATTYFMFGVAGQNAEEWDIGDLSGWNFENLVNVGSMFYGVCNNCLTFEMDLSRWNVSKVTGFTNMFQNAAQNVEVFDLGNLSSWNVSNATSFNGLFDKAGQNAEEWYIGDISNWDVSSAVDMSAMFARIALASSEWDIGDISKWNTSNVTNMANMFNGTCKNANYRLDLSTWKVPLVTSYDNFNYGVTEKITPPVWVN